MRSRFAAGALCAVALLAACDEGETATPSTFSTAAPASSAPCRETPSGNDVLGTQRYLEPVFTDVTVTCDVSYGGAEDEHGEFQELTLDVYVPAGDSETDRPAVLWLTHGGFALSDKAVMPHPEYAARLARRGYVVAVVEYRVREAEVYTYAPPFSDEVLDAAEDAEHDAKAAVRWVRRSADSLGIDADRIAVVGISAGGMTALAVNYDEDDDGESGNPGVDSEVAAAVSLEGCSLDPDTIDGDDGPVLLVHSTDDEAVPYSCAQATAVAATDAGADATLDTRTAVPPLFHGFTNHPALAIDAVVQFLYEQIGS